jgi:ABC-2 type transport system permease protein
MLVRDFLGKYRRSPSAVAFSIVAPLVQVLVITLAVGIIMNAGPKNLSAYIMCATIPFGFFQSSVMSAFTGIDAMQPLIKRIYFPRELFVITYVTTNFFQMVISLFVFLTYRYVVLVHWFGWPGPPPHEIVWLPVLMLLTYMLTLGTAFFTSATFFYFEDIRFIVNVVLGLLFYLVPIMYWPENIFYANRIQPVILRKIIYDVYLLNPIAWIVTAFKQIFFGRQIISQRGHQLLISAPFDYRFFVITIISTTLVLAAGYLFFNQMKWKFAERP